MTRRWMSTKPARGDIARGLATLRSDPALFRMKLRQRWGRGRQNSQPGQATSQSRVASIDQTLATVIADLRRVAVRSGIIYGDQEFRTALADGTPDIAWVWVSHRDGDLLTGAMPVGAVDLAERDAIVVGGADVKTAYLNALRWVERSGTILPVCWVGTNFEFCGSTLPIPAQVEAADIYLFHHFADYFPVKDPLLVRVTASDRRERKERLVLIRPQQTVHFALDDLLPAREGTVVVEIRTTHPVLTGNRHPRWRVWADLIWRDSFTSLHGAHDYGPEHICESRIPLAECESGSIVLTVPNYDRQLSALGANFRWTEGDEKGSFVPDDTVAVDQVTVPRSSHGGKQARFWGYRYRGYGTSYWFAFDEDAGQARPSLSGNHEVTVAQVEHRPPLSAERRMLLEQLEEKGFLFLPHGLPVLDPSSDLELGFSFEAANPQVRDFEVVTFDGKGQLLDRGTVTLPSRGYHYTDEVLGRLNASGRPELVLVSPDWKRMKVDPQHVNAFGNLAVRNKKTGDRDVTEFQSCWRNLNATVDGFPHWLHPSKGVMGRTSVVGHVRTRRELRTGLVLVNGAGTLKHSARATITVRLHSPSGAAQTSQVELAAFTGRLLWLDELFANLSHFLGEAGHGTCLVSSSDADLNCQILTCSATGSVSLQHLWGY